MPAPSFSKAPSALVARFDELAALVPDAKRRPMFGYPSLVLGGNMFMSLFGDHLILRLGEADRDQITSKHGATTFEAMPGRPMKEYVSVPAPLTASAAVEDWVTRAHAYATTLPAKKPKARRQGRSASG